MIRFIFWIFTIALAIGFGPRLVAVTERVAQAAVDAHMHDQMSYAKFTKQLLTAKPRSLPKAQHPDSSH